MTNEETIRDVLDELKRQLDLLGPYMDRAEVAGYRAAMLVVNSLTETETEEETA